MDDRLVYLLNAHLENTLTEEEVKEFRELLRSSPESRRQYWEFVEQHALVEDILAEQRGHDLALTEDVQAVFATPASTKPMPRKRSRWLAMSLILTTMAAAILLAVLIYPVVNSTSDVPAEQLATVHPISGDVQIIDNSGTAKTISRDTAIFPGQLLQIGEEEGLAEVRFGDGARVTISSGTSIQFPASPVSTEKLIHIVKGAAQVHATASPLVITTDHVRITSTATHLRLYRDQKSSRVELEGGKAHLESANGENPMELSEGNYVIATDVQEPMVPQPLSLHHCRLQHTFLRAGDAVRFSPDGTRMLTSHVSRGLKVWDTINGELLHTAPRRHQRTDGLAFTPTKDTVITLGNRGEAEFWTFGEAEPTKTALRQKGLRSGSVSEDGRWIAQGTSREEVLIWEADADKGRISLRQTLPIRTWCVALNRDGSRIALSRWSGDIELYDTATGKQLDHYKLSRTPIPLVVSADANFLAAYANKEGLMLIDRHKGQRLNLWDGEGARVMHLEFTPNGRLLLAGLNDGTVRTWSTVDGECLLVLDTGHRVVRRVTVTADLSLLATVGNGDCVKIWQCEELPNVLP